MKYLRSIFVFLFFTAINSAICYCKMNNISNPAVDNFIIIYNIYNTILVFIFALIVLILLLLFITKDNSNETKKKFESYKSKMQKDYKHIKFQNNFMFKTTQLMFTFLFGFFGMWYLFSIRLISHFLNFIYNVQIKSLAEGE